MRKVFLLTLAVLLASQFAYASQGLDTDQDSSSLAPQTEASQQVIAQKGKRAPRAPVDDDSAAPPKIWKIDGIFFDSGKSSIKPQSFPVLRKVVRRLVRHPGINIMVVGHTDNEGNKTSNLKLSYERAFSVLTWFLANGIPKTRIQADGLGEDYPIAPNTTVDGRASNRRIELITYKPGEQIDAYKWKKGGSR